MIVLISIALQVIVGIKKRKVMSLYSLATIALYIAGLRYYINLKGYGIFPGLTWFNNQLVCLLGIISTIIVYTVWLVVLWVKNKKAESKNNKHK